MAKRIINSSEVRDVKDVKDVKSVGHMSKIRETKIDQDFDKLFHEKFPDSLFNIQDLREGEDLWNVSRNPVISLSIGDHAILRGISLEMGISQQSVVTFLLRKCAMEFKGKINPSIPTGSKRDQSKNVGNVFKRYL